MNKKSEDYTWMEMFIVLSVAVTGGCLGWIAKNTVKMFVVALLAALVAYFVVPVFVVEAMFLPSFIVSFLILSLINLIFVK